MNQKLAIGVPERALLAAIVKHSNDAIVSKDINGIVTSWNSAAERIFGYTADEMIGRPIRVLAAPDRPGEMPLILERIRRGETVEHFETVRKRKDGQLVDISLTVSPIRNEAGVIVGASKIARVITERKRMEREMLRQSELMARRNAELEQFAYITSHDLQEPLRGIVSFSQLLKQRYRGKLDPDADEFIDFITGSAARMSELIRDLLAYSRLTTDQRMAEPVDTRECLKIALANLDRTIAENRADISADPLPRVMADKTSVVQLFQNLISNAIKYRSAQRPAIRVSVARAGDFHVISITDNGIGIQPEYQQKIFGLFKRLHGLDYAGTGIGLALCKKIVEQYGGEIGVKSQAGEGSTFYFSLRAVD